MIKFDNKTKFLLVIAITIIGVYFGFQYVLPLFIPFILAVMVAWILLPVVRFLNQRLKIPRLIGGIFAMGLLGTAVVWGLTSLCNILMKQIVIFLRNLPIYLSILSGHLDSFCKGCDEFLGIQFGSARQMLDGNIEVMLDTVKNKLIPGITMHGFDIAFNIIGVVGVALIVIVSAILLMKDETEYEKGFRENVFYSDIHLVTSKLSETGIAYLRAQAIMMIFIGVLCTAALLLIKNKYALLIGIGIGIFDAFPVLGSGLILIPWSIISLFNRDLYSAAVLMTLYLACQVVRQCLEPKLLGNRIGIKPVYTLMSMYVGIRLFGFAGFLLGPLGLVIITTIVKETQARFF